MICVARFGTALLLTFAASVAARAQTWRGVVRDSASGLGVPGAVIEFLDANRLVVARTVSGERGAYFTSNAPNVRSLRAVRIGFRPRTIELDAATDTKAFEYNFALLSLPALLDAVSVRSQPACPRRSDRAAALALWEQARAGVLAMVVARDANPPFVNRLMYQRLPNEDRPNMLSQIVRADSATDVQPFTTARQLSELIKIGFVERGDSTRTLYAPDADVLLDELFATHYCLRLAAPDRDRPQNVGLQFATAAPDQKHIDIEGVLWIDSTARALDRLEYRYVGLPAAELAVRPGGFIGFRSMPSGTTFVDRWHIRSAIPAMQGDRGVVTTSNRQLDEQFYGMGPRRFVIASETGGALVAAKWTDGATWTAPLGTIRGRLTENNAPKPGVRVRLIATPFEAVTDAEGRFEFVGLLEGRYAIAIPDSLLNSIGQELTQNVDVAVARDSVTAVEVQYRGLDAFMRGLCPDNEGTRGVIVGRIRAASGARALQAKVSVWQPKSAKTTEWQRINSTTTLVGRRFGASHDGELGNGGVFWSCGIPAGTPLRVDADYRGERTSVGLVTNPATQRVFVVDLRLEGREP